MPLTSDCMHLVHLRFTIPIINDNASGENLACAGEEVQTY